jgi:DNA-binding XRE family transcriptional regulator
MSITGDQVRMARAALQWTAQELATKAAISKNTVAAVESGADAHATTLAAIERALIEGGIQFIAENGGGVGVRLAKRRKARAR